jgi:ribosomal-protein-alanine N-acetyltransferase
MNALSIESPPLRARRAMQEADLDAVLAIEVRAYSHPWSRGNFRDSLSASYLAQVLECQTLGVVGYFVAMPGVDELHLLNITIDPDLQGQGLGSSLLHAVMVQARERGLRTLWLEVRQSNLRAQALYLRHGFTVVGLRRGYYPAPVRREDAVLMSLPLWPATPDLLAQADGQPHVD